MNSQYKKFVFVTIFHFIWTIASFGQYTKTASCADITFDQKVNSTISYTAPVIGVKKAFENKKDYLFLDAREFNEYTVSHISQARYIGYDDFDIATIKDIAKDKKIIVYCSIGYRSEKIATKLQNMGFKHVYNLYGSIFEWANAGYPLSDKNGKPTQAVHTFNKEWSKWVLNPTIAKIW
jgi:rhodanese-related sulfurtransferase